MTTVNDTLWTLVRWSVPLAVAAVIAVGALGPARLDGEVRRRVEERLAATWPGLVVTVQAAAVTDGRGIVVRGVSVVDPTLPQQWRQLVWVEELRLSCGTSLAELARGTPRITAVHLRRPVVHAVCRGGEWSVARLLRRQAGGMALVPVTVEDATLLLDGVGNASRFTLRQVVGDLAPRPDGTARVRASCAGDVFERGGIEMEIAPATDAFSLSGRIDGLDVGPRLMALLPVPPGATAGADWMAGVRGRVGFDWRASGTLSAPGSAAVAVTGQLDGGRFEHPAIPFPLSGAVATFTADRAGLVVQQLDAHSGTTRVRGSGRLAGWSAAADFDLVVEADRLTVGRQWEGLLPESWAAQWCKLLPSGEIDLRAQLARRAGRIDPQVSIRCRNASLTHYRFPYRIDRTVGTVILDSQSVSIHLTGQAGGHPVHVEGSFRSQAAGTVGLLEVRGDAMRIDDALLAALPPRSSGIVRALQAEGTFDFVFQHERSPSLPGGQANRLGIRLVDCSLRYAGFPYPLSRVTGHVRMDDGHWMIRDISGVNDTGTVRCSGQLLPLADGDGELTLQLTGTGVVLERELRDALPRGVQTVWDDLDPRGNAQFTATVRHRVKSRQTSVKLEARPEGDTVSIEPAWFPYRLERLQGRLSWENGWLRFDDVRGAHARTSVAAAGTCRFTPDGGWHVSFQRLSADRFRADQDLLQAMPAGLRTAINAVRPRGLLSLDGTLDLYSTAAGPDGRPGPAAASWDMRFDVEQGALDVGVPLEHVHGGLRLVGQSDGRRWQSSGEVDIDSAQWRGHQITALAGPLVADADGVRFGAAAAATAEAAPRRLTARLAGGTLALDGSVASSPVGGFSVSLALGEADLERLAADAAGPVAGGAPPYRGRIYAVAELTGSRAGPHSLIGRGQVRLRDADIYELPVMVALLKVLQVKLPDRKAFSSSVVDFRVEGPHAYLDTIELAGDAISLVGNGELDFDSRVHLTLRSIMGDSEAQLPAMKRMLGGASGQFMLVHVDGTLAQPEITTEAFPTLTAALQQLQSRQPSRTAAATQGTVR
ncbi:MAG: AsmA-like C-terminal region-containing protein [Pirellulales bacterium]